MALLGATLALGGAMAATAGPRRFQTPERDFVCPERLPDEAARFAAMKRFMRRYETVSPHLTMNERLARYDRLLAKRKCAEPGEQYTFPQP